MKNIKSKKTCPGFLFLSLDLEEIIFLCSLCYAKKAVILYLISLSYRVTFMEIPGKF